VNCGKRLLVRLLGSAEAISDGLQFSQTSLASSQISGNASSLLQGQSGWVGQELGPSIDRMIEMKNRLGKVAFIFGFHF
jgi:hypothetical protein